MDLVLRPRSEAPDRGVTAHSTMTARGGCFSAPIGSMARTVS